MTEMKRKISKKTATVILSVALVLGLTLGGTLAWLTDTTEEVTNTFTTSDVSLSLDETTGEEYKMIPGWAVDKDPLVTVKAGSEDCWIFLKVQESDNLDTYINYAIDENNWTELEDGVYYIKVTDIKLDRNIKVLAGGSYKYKDMTFTWEPNQVLTKPEVSEEMMDALEAEGATLPKLTFTAYASQLYKTNDVEFTPEEAWNLVKDLSN